MAKKIIIPSIVLTVICLVISAALAFTNDITKDRIAEINRQNQEILMSGIFTDCEFSEREIGEDVYYIAKKNGNFVGYVFTTTETGYGGDVKVMTGISPNGNVKAVEVISCADETPGLGQSAKNNAEFLGQFEGKSAEISTVKNDEIDALTGATITTNAVINDVNEALQLYAKVVKEGGEQ